MFDIIRNYTVYMYTNPYTKMLRVNIGPDEVFLQVLQKASEILAQTRPVEIDGVKQPLCSPDAIYVESDKENLAKHKLRNEIWLMNNLDNRGLPTDATDAFMCFGTLDFDKLFMLSKDDGVEDFQKQKFKELIQKGVIHFSVALQHNGRYLSSYSFIEKSQAILAKNGGWFDGFIDSEAKEVKGKRYDDVCMLHWVAKKATSKVKRLVSLTESIIVDAGYKFLFLQVGCKDVTKLAYSYSLNNMEIVVLTEQKSRSRRTKRQSVVIKDNAEWGFVFWAWKELSTLPLPSLVRKLKI